MTLPKVSVLSLGGTQGKQVDHSRRVLRQLEGDDAAVGVPHDMRLFHAQVAQQSPAVCGLPGDAYRPGGAATTRIAAAVVVNEPVPIRQARLG